MRSSSIRWRIQLWHGILLIVVVSTMSLLFFFHERSLRKERLGVELRQVVSTLIPRYIRPAGRLEGQRQHPPRRDFEPRGPEEGPRLSGPRAGRLPVTHETERTPPDARSMDELVGDLPIYYIIASPEGEIRHHSANTPKQALVLEDIPALAAETFLRTRGEYLEAVHYAPRIGRVISGIPLNAFEKSLHAFGLRLTGASLCLIGLGLGVGWWMLGRETAQLSVIARSAERIAHGDLSERIPLTSKSWEIRNVVEVLNESFGRLERSFEQQVRFTADASHELRTPVSVILTKGQYALSKERSAQEYQEALATSVEAAKHMRKMIESLLELARFDSGEAALNLEERDLVEVVIEAVELLLPLAEEKLVRIVTAYESAMVKVDSNRIQQVVINLLSNAIRHSPYAGELHVSVARDGDRALFVVADEGAGIDEKELPYLFDRFFRGKPMAESGEDSTGLGLAISKAIVLAHGGSIQASNRNRAGAVFRIELPMRE